MKTLNIDGERCFTVVDFAKFVGLELDIFSIETDRISLEAVARRCTNPQYLLYRESDLLRFCEWLHQQGQIAGRYVDLHKAIDDHIDRENANVEKEVNAEQEGYTWVKPDACKVTAILTRHHVEHEPPETRKRGKPGYAEMPVKRAIITLQVKNNILAIDSPPILASDIHDYLRQVKSIAIPISTIKDTNAYKAYRKSWKEKK